MELPIDQRTDNGQFGHALFSILPIPDFVKQGSIPEDLPPSLYADPVHKLFPVHEPGATWTSHVYFTSQKMAGAIDDDYAEPVQRRLNRAIRLWGIVGPCEKATVALEQQAAKAAAADEYMLDIDGMRRYLVTSPEGLKKAAARFYNERDVLPYKFRKAAAKKFLAKAAEYSCDPSDDPEVSDYIRKAAGIGVGNPKKIAYAIGVRIAVLAPVQDPKPIQTKMAKLAVAVADATPSVSLMEKLAEILDRFDKETGLRRLYKSGGLDLPEELCFEVSRGDLINLKEQLAMIGDKIYKTAELESIPLESVEHLLGKEAAAKMSSDGRVDPKRINDALAEMDRPKQIMFHSLLKHLSIEPVA